MTLESTTANGNGALHPSTLPKLIHQDDEPESFTLGQVLDRPPKQPDYVFDGLWEARTAGMLTADGGTGKSHFAFQIGYAVASGTAIDGTPLQCLKVRPFVYISQEDEGDHIEREWKKQYPNMEREVADRIRVVSTAIQGDTLLLTSPSTQGTIDKHMTRGAVFALDSFSTFVTSDENNNTAILKGEVAALHNIMKKWDATALL